MKNSKEHKEATLPTSSFFYDAYKRSQEMYVCMLMWGLLFAALHRAIERALVKSLGYECKVVQTEYLVPAAYSWFSWNVTNVKTNVFFLFIVDAYRS